MVYLPHYEERIEAEEGDEDNDIYPSSYPTLLPVAATSSAAAAAAAGPSTSTYHLDLEAAAAAAAAGMEEKGEDDSEAAAFPATLDLCSAGSLRVVAEQEEALRALYDRYSCGERQGKQQQQQQQEQEEGIGGMRFEVLQAGAVGGGGGGASPHLDRAPVPSLLRGGGPGLSSWVFGGHVAFQK